MRLIAFFSRLIDTKSSEMKVAMFNAHHTGHVNPTIELVKLFVKRGIEVHYFLPYSLKEKIESIGATYHNYGSDDWSMKDAACQQTIKFGLEPSSEQLNGILPLITDPATVSVLPYILSQLKTIQPNFCVSDSCLPWGFIACQILNIPIVSSCSSSLIDVNERAKTFGHRNQIPFIKKSVEWLKETYNIDYDSNKSMCNYSDFTIVWSVPQIFPEIGQSPNIHAFGTSMGLDDVDTGDRGIDKDKDNELYDTIQCIRVGSGDAGRPQSVVVYVSMGSVIGTEPVVPSPVGYFRELFEALKPENIYQLQTAGGLAPCVVHVVLIVGPLCDFGELSQEAPSNFILRKWVDQKRLLPLVDIFFSHCGMNSFTESLFAACPILGTPAFGDQMVNAAKAQELSCGLALPPASVYSRDTCFDHLSSTAIATAMRELCCQYLTYKASCQAISAALRERLDFLHSGRAVDEILAWVEGQRAGKATLI